MKKISKFFGAFAVMALAGTLSASAALPDKLYTIPSNAQTQPELPSEVYLLVQNGGKWDAEFMDYAAQSADITLTGPNGLNQAITVTKADFGEYGPDEDYGIKLRLPKAYTEDGTYTFTVPEGKFYFAYPIADNSFSFSFEVKGGTVIDPNAPTVGVPSGYYVDPKPGTYAADKLGGKFTISFSTFQTYDYDKNEPGAIEGNFVTMDGPTGQKTYLVKSEVLEVFDPDTGDVATYPNGRALGFNVPAADFATPGTYTMTAKLAGISTYPENMGKDFTWTYTVEGAAPAKPEANVTITPAPGEVTAIPETIEVKFNDEEWAMPLPNVNPMVEIAGPNGYSRKAYAVNKMVSYQPSNILQINLSEPITIPGTYVFSFSCDDLSDGDNNLKYADVEFSYTLKGATPELKDLAYTVRPQAGEVTEFPSEITIEVPSFGMLILADANVNPAATITGENDFVQQANVKNIPGNYGIPSNQVKVVVDPAITTPGKYTVTIPANKLAGDDGQLEGYNDIKIEYTLKEKAPQLADANVTINPAAGDVAEFPAKIEVTFKDQEAVSPIADVEKCVTITGPEGYSATFAAKNLGEFVNTITVLVDPVPTVEGEYTVTMDVNGLANGNEQRLSTLYNNVVFKYNLKKGVVPPVTDVKVEITPDPAAGMVEAIPQEIEVVFPDFMTIMSNDGKVGATLKMTCAAHEISKEFFSNNAVHPEGGSIMIKGFKFAVDGDYTLPGVYKFSVDFSNYKGYNSDMSTKDLGLVEFEYIVGGVTTRIEPAPGQVSTIGEVKVTVTSAEKIELAENAEVTLKAANGTTHPVEVKVEGNVLVITATPEISDAGEYTITIPAGSLIVDDNAFDKPIYIDYIIKTNGIEAIFVNGQKADIYGIDGTIRVRKADIEAVRNLDKGIYIIGGQKVIVK